MTNQSNPIFEAKRLFHLGQLPAAIRLAESAIASPDLAPQAQLLQARCLMEQGHFRRADALLAATIAVLPADSELAREICLRRTSLQIYLAGHSSAIVKESRGTLAENPSPRLTALAQDLLGRALAIAVVWNLEPPSKLVEARHLLSAACNNYHRAGDRDAALAALLKRGQLHLLAIPDLATAQSLFQKAHHQAQAEGNQVRQAEAALRLAELEFDAILAQRAKNPEVQMEPASYQRALTLYEAVGHGFGPADVLLSFSSRLLKAGFDGTEVVQRALQQYGQVNHLSGNYNALIELSTWHLQQGELSQSLDCRQRAATIAQEMDFPLAQATAYLGIGDYYYRTGNYARALAAYERVEQLAAVPSVLALQGLNLANAYTLMNLPDRAQEFCYAAIKILKQAGPSKNLSLAYFILGNVLSTRGDWTEAISVWREGLRVDETCQNRFDQAEKLKCMAQATVMQHHRPDGSPIPEAAYKEAMALYSQGIDLLNTIGSNEATAAVAGIYQLQGQTALTCGHPLDALKYLEQSRNTYAVLNLKMQIATTDALLGLACHHLGNRSYPHLYTEAIRCYERALDYFQSAQMRDQTWKICFYLADMAFLQSFQALRGEQQQAHWQDADRRLEEAAKDIELVRGRFIEVNPVTREYSRLGLVADKEKVYNFAIKLHHGYLQDRKSAFNWLERLKGRAFLDALAITPLRPPAWVDGTLLEQEQELLAALKRASSQTEVVELSERLHGLWEQMKQEALATEYVSLRLGEPMRWETLKSLLHFETGSINL